MCSTRLSRAGLFSVSIPSIPCSSAIDGNAETSVAAAKSLDARTTMYQILSMPNTRFEKTIRRLSMPIARYFPLVSMFLEELSEFRVVLLDGQEVE